jgi:P-type Ca2+ transporter type 2C
MASPTVQLLSHSSRSKTCWVKCEHSGLTAEEAALRLAAEGPNALPDAAKRTAPRIVLEVLREPMLALLLAGGLAYMLLGDLAEALILLGFATFSVVVTVVQETRTEHVLEALRDLSAPRALVIRGGERVRVAGGEVVRGDLLVLEQGDRVPADTVLFSAHDLEADESLLTGESIPVGKCAPGSASQEAGDERTQVFSGTMITRGSGMGQVTAIGSQTRIGRIGASLATLETEAPRLRLETARIVKFCAAGGGAVALLVVLLYGLTRGGWIEAVLAGITTGMSMLPEEIPVVLTIFLAMGAWKIGKAGVLTRRAAAIEALGSTTVLCSDKTGTLTENRMAVARLWLPSHGMESVSAERPLPDHFAHILGMSALASAVEAADPMELAIHEAGRTHYGAPDRDWSLSHSYGLRPDLLAMANRWRTDDPDRHLVAAKGAPEAIAVLCRMSAAEHTTTLEAADAMARQGIRVLGVATAETADPDPLERHSDYPFRFVGLLGLADPLRQSVPAAVAECRSAGIKVVMITGDYAATAQTIAAEAGIAAGEVLTGSELDALSDAQLAARLPQVSVFARIMPEQKLRIVEAYKASGEVVAMTGDGVNDAPSLKAAHIGIAMGKRGTDVAREAASIVLLDDEFGSIVRTIALGRTIYDNIRKAMGFIFAVHVPIAGLALLPLLTGLPLLFGPIHIALLEMVIDPVCALVFEAERSERDIMQRRPRALSERLFSLPMIVWSVLQGLIALLLLGAVYLGSIQLGLPAQEVRALTFFALVAAIIALVFVNRSFKIAIGRRARNRALELVLAAVAAVTAVILLVVPIRGLLGFAALHIADLAVVGATGLALFLALEALKPVATRAWHENDRHLHA